MTEHQPYDVVGVAGAAEVRRYPEHVVAEITVEDSFESAGNRAFRPLAGYIGGRNRPGAKVAMTAPVLQEAEPPGRAPRAPTPQTQPLVTEPLVTEPLEGGGRYVVSFVMPAGRTRDTLPEPADPRVRVRTVPPQDVAALRYSGRWSRAAFDAHAARLLAEVAAAGLEATGPPRFARYDPPWTPWFLRRNEVLVPVARR